MSRYNLIDKAWIPVIDLDGNRQEVNIRDALVNSEMYAAIEDPSPLVTAALYRFLLAILYRALEGPCDPTEARKLFLDGLPKEIIEAYLNEWKPRFYLFDEKYPFGQCLDIPKEKNTTEPWTKLSAEFNGSTSKVLNDHTDYRYTYAPGYEAISKWIISTMNFSVRGGRGYSPSPSADGLIVIPVGKNMLQTLMFCLSPYPNKESAKNDTACWELDPISFKELKKKPVRASKGFADRYTWYSRGIRLFNERNCSIIGFTPGIRHLEENAIRDPFIPTTVHMTKGVVPTKLEDKGLWREFNSLIPNPTGNAPKVMDNMLQVCNFNRSLYASALLVIGQSFSNAKIEFWRMEKFVLPSRIVESAEDHNSIQELLEKADNVAGILEDACKKMSKKILTHGERDLEPDKWKAGKLIPGDITKFINSVGAIKQYWSVLEIKFTEALMSFSNGDDPDDILYNWLFAVKRSLQKAWNLHEQLADGSDAWVTRALVSANKIIGKQIKEINEDIEKLKPVEKLQTAEEAI